MRTHEYKVGDRVRVPSYSCPRLHSGAGTVETTWPFTVRLDGHYGLVGQFSLSDLKRLAPLEELAVTGLGNHD